ncbi:MAG TPA: hypothetical protein VIF09_03945, partial [Polyangiaceae bacterium]
MGACGSSGGNSPFTLGDAGGTSSGGGHGDAASSSGASSSSGGASSSGGFGDDATTGDATASSSGGTSDAALDISFPDSFFGPDGSSSSSGSSSGGDSGSICSPDGITCNGNTAEICNAGVLTTKNCATLTPAQTCSNGYGCVVCQPGTGTCSGNTGTACNSTGSGTVTNVCDPLQGETCDTATGQCDGDCASVGTSYIGCEYYAVTMANAEVDQTTFFFSVSISNTTTKSATITITGPSYNQTFTLAAGAIQDYQLPWVNAVSCNGGTCNGFLPL